jgi:hypothetical protein
MKNILKVILFTNIHGMKNDNSSNIIEIQPPQQEKILTNSELNNMVNYVSNLGHHTYTDHCPKIKDSQEKLEKLDITVKDLNDTINDCKDEIEGLKTQIYMENSRWKCQII